MSELVIKTLEISGFRAALEALRMPFSLKSRSESVFTYIPAERNNGQDWFHTNVWLDQKDLLLLTTLVKRGPEHAKCIRGINVYAKITAPIYWWCEMETYTIGHYRLASESTMHVECRGLSGEELVKAKSEIPMGKMMTKVDVFNYQNLRNIYFQRRNHRLPEWHQFCEWIKTLPYANELILTE